MKVELVDITENSAEKIGKSAGICYGKDDDNVMRCEKVVKYRHLSCLRFAYATFHISEISRTCSHQLVRHKHLDYLQRSQRYVEEFCPGFVYPKGMPTGDTAETNSMSQLARIYLECLRTYKVLLSLGAKKEDARYVLPNATYTELYVTGNFEAWHHFIELRLTKQAQWEIRGVAAGVWSELYEHCPPVFQEFTEKHDELFPKEI